MDPFTHGVVGMAIGAASQGGVSWANGALAACALGAMAPDLDIIAQIWGDLAYLKQHRGISHSIPGLLAISLITAGILKIFYPLYTYSTLLSWSFLGALSHSCLDLFNSYGVRILWPLSRKMWTVNLLMLVDPVLIVGSILILRKGSWGESKLLIPVLVFFYLLLRWALRYQAQKIVENHLGYLAEKIKIVVMPSRCRFFIWDFIVKLPDRHIVGCLDLLQRQVRVFCKLRRIKGEMREVFLRSPLGRVFREFTPLFHVLYEIKDNKIIAHFMDLRYYAKDRFLHNGKLVMDLDFQVEEAVFQPYAPSRCNHLAN